MLLSHILSNVDIIKTVGTFNIQIDKIAYDSRMVEKNTVFVCIKGYKADGHDFVAHAIDNGAIAIIAEREFEGLNVPIIVVKNTRKALAKISSNFYNNPSDKLSIIGVTGTNGKTTTTYLIKSILETNGKKVGLIGTIQNMIGDIIIETDHTTPESLDLQALLAKMVDNNVEYVVMEVSSHSIELNRVYGCKFDFACFTNLTHDHLNFHGNMDNYFNTKSKLFDLCKNAVINIDDDSGQKLFAKHINKSISYSTKTTADVFATNIVMNEKGVRFLCNTPKGTIPIDFSMPGSFSVYNAICAASLCIELGIGLDIISQGIKKVTGVNGRIEVVYSDDDYSVIIDFAHTPDGLKNIITAVSGFAKGRIIIVFGCDGNADSTKRPKMGKIAGELADYCVITSSDNPKNVTIPSIINNILEGLSQTVCPYTIIEDRYNAIKYAIDNAQHNDTILVTGKGHENYQEIDGIKRHFDEKKIIAEIIENNKQK